MVYEMLALLFIYNNL